MKKFDVREFGTTYEEIRKRFSWPKSFNFVKGVDENEGIALIEDGKPISYQEIREKSNGISKSLKELGVKHVVAGLLPQSSYLAFALIGSYKNNNVFLSMSTLLGIEAIKYRLEHSQSSLIFTISDYTNKIREISKNIIIVSDDGGDYSYKDIERASNVEYAEHGLSDPAHLFYTSGTTGEPKGVLLPKSWILGHLPAWQIALDLAPRQGDTFMTPAEWAWIGGLGDLVLPALYYGTKVIVYRRQGRFDPVDFAKELEKHKVTGAFMVPTAVRMIRNSWDEVKKHDVRLRAIISGGEIVDAELIRWTKENMNTDLNQIYGQTEVNLVICNSPLIMKVKPEFTGPECPGHRVVIIDEDGNEARPNTIGEIAVKLPDPSAMIEYYKNPEATRLKIRNGFIFTGDMGYVDEEGYVKFVGRKDDVVKVSGYRVSTLEVESVISKHPAVGSCAVVDVEDKLRGSILAAFIVVKEGYKPSSELEEDIKNFVKDKLAKYAYPRFIFFVNELPRTLTGKIRKVELRRMAEELIKKEEEKERK